MEKTPDPQTKTVPEKVVDAPAEVGTVIVHGTETVTSDVAKGAEEGATIIVHATKVVISDINQASKQLGRDAKQAVHPAPRRLDDTTTDLPVKPSLGTKTTNPPSQAV
jgi:hypothetical protein